ncbi:MAG: hypothetical protein QE280_02675 [Caulobacter sp.]|nr:hypothetical protein [Caulobacter sp.]
MTGYAKRESGLESGVHCWRIDPQSLVWERPNGETLTLLWRDVTDLRIAFAPTRWKPWRRLLELRARHGRRLVIDNSHYRGLGDFEDRSASFRTFALDCIDQVARAAPAARGWIGSRLGDYLARLLLAMLATALLIWVLIALPTPLGLLVVLKLLLILASLPMLILWAIRARPRRAAISPEGVGRSLT